jgi:hypothetical protein
VRRQDHHVAWPAARARETSAAYTTEEATNMAMTSFALVRR